MVYSGLNIVLSSDFQDSVSYNLVMQIIEAQRMKSREDCMKHNLGDTRANFPTPHFCLDLDLWEPLHNNVTSTATSLNIWEDKVIGDTMPSHWTLWDLCWKYTGKSILASLCLTKQSINLTSLVIKHHCAQNVVFSEAIHQITCIFLQHVCEGKC